VLDQMEALSKKYSSQMCVVLLSVFLFSPADALLARREIRLGLKLHHRLCAERHEKIRRFVDEYGEEETQAKTDVETIVKALFPNHRFGSQAYQSLMECVSVLLHALPSSSPFY
jgi:hypothetical protein